MVAWCPDSARIKKKMVYSASFDSLKKAFTGVQKIIQANGADEVEQSVVENLLRAAARTWNFRFRFCLLFNYFRFIIFLVKTPDDKEEENKQTNWYAQAHKKNVIWK